MVIDLDRCAACQACTVACRQENNVPFAGAEQTEMGRAIFWNEVIPIVEEEGTKIKARFIPRPCMHCENPPCVKVCPVGATYKSEEGVVAQIYSRCIGCRYCTTACPYTARYFNWYKPQRVEGMEHFFQNSHNPDVSIRTKGVVEKCTFCYQRIRKAKEKAEIEGRELRDGDVVPACVQTCPASARYFGDLDDPNSIVSKLARSRRAFHLLEDLGTEPKVTYLMEGQWHDEQA